MYGAASRKMYGKQIFDWLLQKLAATSPTSLSTLFPPPGAVSCHRSPRPDRFHGMSFDDHACSTLVPLPLSLGKLRRDAFSASAGGSLPWRARRCTAAAFDKVEETSERFFGGRARPVC